MFAKEVAGAARAQDDALSAPGGAWELLQASRAKELERRAGFDKEHADKRKALDAEAAAETVLRQERDDQHAAMQAELQKRHLRLREKMTK